MGTEKYIDVFKEIFLERIEAINLKSQKLKHKEVRPDFIDSELNMLSLDFETIGIGEYILNSNIIKSKENFYMSAKLKEIHFESFESKAFSVVPQYVSMSSYLRLYSALVSDCDTIILALAKLMGGREDIEKKHGHPFANNVGYAMKYILLGEDANAKVHVKNLIQMREQKDMKHYNGQGMVLESILNSDEEGVNAGLKYMLESHRKRKKDYADTPQELFSIPVVGMAKLAQRRGITVNIDDPIAPKAMLEKHEITYPKVDFI